jgi:hypothetical protein
VISDALEHNAARPDVQDLPALLAYVYARGHDWADRTSIECAIDEIGSNQSLESSLRDALIRLLELRSRVSGPEWSVADVDRVQWYRRRVDAWNRAVVPSAGISWPGGSAWIDLRISHLRSIGWTTSEISGVLRISRRSVRQRIRRLSCDISWVVLSPCVALSARE